MSAPVAILDIGSNSVRFAILERGQEGAFFVPGGRKEICTTRLGKGLDKTGRLSPVPMADTVKAMADRGMETDIIQVCVNTSKQIRDRHMMMAGNPIYIITGKKNA